MSFRRTWVFIVLMLVLPCLCYWEVFDGKLLLPTDWVYRDVEPWRQLAEPPQVFNSRIKDAFLDGFSLDAVSARAAREGRVALWNPYMGGGTPHLAAGFSRMLYPPFWIYAILPLQTARNVEILLHVFLAELFAFFFLRRVGCSLGGALFGAIAFGFSPSIVHRSEIPFILPSLVWYPLLLLFVEDVLKITRLRAFAGLSVAVALQMLAGHYPDIFINFFGAAVYGVSRLLVQKNPSVIALGGFRCLAAVVLGVSFAAPFLFPSWELIQQSNRPVTSLEELTNTAPGWTIFATLFSPWASRSQLYFGVIASIFLPAAFLSRGRAGSQTSQGLGVERGVAVSLLVVAFTVIAVASGSPLLRLLHSTVPGFEGLNYVSTMVSVAAFSLALLAGIGLSNALEGSLTLERALALLLIAAGSILMSWIWLTDRSQLLPQFRLPGILILILLLAVFLETRRRRRFGASALTAAVCILLCVELMSYARKFNPRVDTATYAPFPSFPGIDFLREDPELFRVATLRGKAGRRPFLPNSLSAYGVEDVSAYHSLLPRRVGAYLQRARLYIAGATSRELQMEWDPSSNILHLDSFRPNNLLRVWNIKYFILPRGEENPDPNWLELVYDGEVRIFRLGDSLPRAWLTEELLVLPGEQGVLTKLLDRSVDPRRTVLLETEPGCYPPAATADPVALQRDRFRRPGLDSVELIESDEERRLFETQSSAPSYLVISETYDRGWKVTVNGRSAPVFRANLNFLAVSLASGRNRVTLEYKPLSYSWGWIACGLGVIGLFFLFLLSRWKPEAQTAFLFMIFLPGTIALFGWQSQSKSQAVTSCGQMRVAQRLSDPSDTRLVHRRNGSFAAAPIDVPGEYEMGNPEEGLLRFRLALNAQTDGLVLAEIVADGGDDGGAALIGMRVTTHRRWLSRDVTLPGGRNVRFRAVPGEAGGAHSESSLLLGAPMVFRTGPRTGSIVLFLGPGGDPDGWRAMLPELEPQLEEDNRLRMLLTRRSTETSGLAYDEFDEVYPSSSNEVLHARLLAFAAQLYRTATVLVVRAEQEGGDGSFTTRQIRALENELDRLGIGETLVEVRVYPEPSTGE